jgi:hypothetical protein
MNKRWHYAIPAKVPLGSVVAHLHTEGGIALAECTVEQKTTDEQSRRTVIHFDCGGSLTIPNHNTIRHDPRGGTDG